MAINRTCLGILLAGTVAAHLGGASAALAQEGVGPRSGGLFEGTRENPESRQKLDFSLSAAEAYDSDSPPELVSVDRFAAISGYSTMFTGTMAYAWQGDRAQIGANGTSVFRYFNEVQDLRSISHSAGFGVSARLNTRTTLFANQSAAYSPWYLFGLFPGEDVDVPGQPIYAAPDYAWRDTESYAYGTTLNINHTLTRRTNLSAGGDFRYTDYVREDPRRRDLRTLGGRGSLSHNLTRNVALSTGYRYRTGDFGGSLGLVAGGETATVTEHSVDVGLDYSRPLSATRRMDFGFSIGAAAIDRPIPTADERVEGRLYRLVGDAAVSYPFGRSWHVRGAYRRGMEYVAGLVEPVFSDGVTFGAGGLLTSRLEFRTGARFATGGSALNRRRMNFDTYTGDVRLRYAVNRLLAVHGEYIYYYYDFHEDALLAPDLASGLERHAARLGLTLWIPAFRK